MRNVELGCGDRFLRNREGTRHLLGLIVQEGAGRLTGARLLHDIPATTMRMGGPATRSGREIETTNSAGP